MDHVRPDHAEPIAAARRQQANLIEPKTDQETQLVNWLANQLDLQRLHVLVELVEYGQERGQSRPWLGERVPCRRAGPTCQRV
jgi:hypothetical protein